jgi:hypothetical protein
MNHEARDKAAEYYAECKEQATRREWSAYGDIRVEAFLAGYAAGEKEISRLESEYTKYFIECADLERQLKKIREGLRVAWDALEYYAKAENMTCSTEECCESARAAITKTAELMVGEK